MKKMVYLLFGLGSLSCAGQNNIEVEKLVHSKFVETMNSIISISKYQTDNFGTTILKLNDLSSTAPTLGTHERMDYYLIAISEFDEYPEQSLFKVGNYYNSQLIKVSRFATSLLIDLKHETETGMKTDQIRVELHSVKVL